MDSEKDKRIAIRRRTLKGVIVSFNGGFSAVEGVLKNMSETGGFLVVKDGLIVPDLFTLISELDGWKAECQVMRRQYNGVGFQYVGEVEKIKPTRHQVISAMNLSDTGEEVPVSNQQEELPVRSRKPVQKAFGKLSS